jgi:4-hydroxy-tetrahydrodipicolinate synthase
MQNSPIQFQGVGVALVTPFDEAGNVDYDGLLKLLEHTGPHVDYFVVNGTTAESPTSTAQERLDILTFVKKHNRWKKPLVYGVGGNSTNSLLGILSRSDFEGIDAILSVSPYYNRPSQEGLYRHYTQLADACPVPVILYNVPPRTASNMEASTTIRLSQHPNIIGIKEASGNLVQCQTILKHAAPGFMLISGDDVLTVPMLSVGGVGVISVIANAFPKEFCQYVHSAMKGDYAKAQKEMMPLFDINQLLFAEGNPTGVKAALALQGICKPYLRMPLIEASENLTKQLQEAMKELA